MEVTGYAIQVLLNAVAYERLTLPAYEVEHCGDTVGALADTLRKVWYSQSGFGHLDTPSSHIRGDSK